MRQLRDDNPNMRVYIKAIMEKRKVNFYKCQSCGISSKKKLVIHHNKYDGATMKDLRIICQRCNTQPENRLLP